MGGWVGLPGMARALADSPTTRALSQGAPKAKWVGGWVGGWGTWDGKGIRGEPDDEGLEPRGPQSKAKRDAYPGLENGEEGEDGDHLEGAEGGRKAGLDCLVWVGGWVGG